MLSFAIGGAFAALVAAAALRVRALSRDGALAALVVGTLTFGIGGLQAAAILLGFFLTSVALTRAGRAKKRMLADIAKGGPRDAVQVLANGGIATACLVIALRDSHPWSVAFAGAYAAATADTWGTEIGTLVSTPPRSLLGGRAIAAGLSGGVTPAGTAAEIAGAFCIAIVAAVVGLAMDLRSFVGIALGGIVGAFADSLLGATVQSRRWCPACQRPCENDPHTCGAATEQRGGIAWLSNDLVNLAATLTGAAVARAFAG